MTRWDDISVDFGRVEDLRLRYTPSLIGGVRFFVLKLDPHIGLELVFTRIYDSIEAGGATVVSDYKTMLHRPADGCPMCGGRLPRNQRAKFCSRECQKRWHSRE